MCSPGSFMRAVSLWPDDDLRTCFLVASGDAGSPGLRLNRGVFVWGIRPRRSRWQLGDLAGEHGEPGLVGVAGRQGNLDAGDHLGHAPRDLDQAEADRVELCLAPEGIACCQAA